jgi:hypothetical protein
MSVTTTIDAGLDYEGTGITRGVEYYYNVFSKWNFLNK